MRFAPLGMALSGAFALAACGQTAPVAATPDAATPDAGAVQDATVVVSDASSDAARDAAPDAARADAGPRPVAFAMTRLFIGDTDWSGAASPVAWKSFGANIDGLVTTAASTDVCTLTAGASSSAQVDGDNGIDNAFGASVLPLIQTFDAQYSANLNQLLVASTFNVLTRIDATAAMYGGGPAFKPAFDGTDVWPVIYESVTAGDVAQPKLRFPSPSMNGAAWISGVSTGQALIALPLSPTENMILHANHVQVTLPIDPGGKTATHGVLSGVFPTEDFIAAFREVAQSVSTSFCSPAAFDSVAAQLRQASDILQDGTNAAGKPCDGISFGFGFDAATVLLGDVGAPSSPPPNVCE